MQFNKLITSTFEDIQIELVSEAAQRIFCWYRNSGIDIKVPKILTMEAQYSEQAVLPHFSGFSKQRGIRFESLAASVSRVALPFVKKFLLPAVMIRGRVVQSKCTVISRSFYTMKNSKKAVKSARRWSVKKVGGQATENHLMKKKRPAGNQSDF